MNVIRTDSEFIYVNVGCTGRVFDSGVIEKVHFYGDFKHNLLNSSNIEVTEGNMNFVLMGDGDFALHTHIS
jgi:hypothetical protein